MGGHESIEQYLEAYPPGVIRLAQELREIVVSSLPGAVETFEGTVKLVGYGFGPGYGDTICTIIASKTGVKLGIARAVELNLPQHLLQGKGKLHKHVAFSIGQKIDGQVVRAILQTAVAAWKVRRGKSSPGFDGEGKQ